MKIAYVLRQITSLFEFGRLSVFVCTELMAYEGFFGKRIADYRRQELKLLLNNCLARATMTSTMALAPVLAAVCE